MNLNVGCYTSATQPATAPFISCTVADGWNGIDCITTITAQSGANNLYNNASRMILDGSYNTNAGKKKSIFLCSQLKWRPELEGNASAPFKSGSLRTLSEVQLQRGTAHSGTEVAFLLLPQCSIY